MDEPNRISFLNGQLITPDAPIIPYIEGDGIGADVWRAASRVIDHAVERCWPGRRKIAWKEILAGEKAQRATGEALPGETIEALQEYRV